MGVDQAGHQSVVAEVDRLCSGRVRDGGAGGDNLVAFHQNFPGRNDAAGFDIEQTRGMKNDWVRGRGSLGAGPADKP